MEFFRFSRKRIESLLYRSLYNRNFIKSRRTHILKFRRYTRYFLRNFYISTVAFISACFKLVQFSDFTSHPILRFTDLSELSSFFLVISPTSQYAARNRKRFDFAVRRFDFRPNNKIVHMSHVHWRYHEFEEREREIKRSKKNLKRKRNRKI